MQSIAKLIRGITPHWVGDGFPVRSLFDYREAADFDPFLLLDYAGPHQFAPSAAKRGVGEHPHRGFETVTIVYEGELEHRDSAGNSGTIGRGDVQWMTAASGIVHEEFHSERFTREGGLLEMVQLWVNLPAAEKMSAPRYQAILNRDIPKIRSATSTVRVIAGELKGIVGPARTVTSVNAWDVQLSPGTERLTLPVSHTTTVVVQRGDLTLNSTPIASGEAALMRPGSTELRLETTGDARLLVLSGEPIREPIVAQGPFVMSTTAEIRQAFDDFRGGSMGRLPDL